MIRMPVSLRTLCRDAILYQLPRIPGSNGLLAANRFDASTFEALVAVRQREGLEAPLSPQLLLDNVAGAVLRTRERCEMQKQPQVEGRIGKGDVDTISPRSRERFWDLTMLIAVKHHPLFGIILSIVKNLVDSVLRLQSILLVEHVEGDLLISDELVDISEIVDLRGLAFHSNVDDAVCA